jgi:hypothetical protein
MNARLDLEELRDSQIATLTSIHAAALRKAVSAGEPQTLAIVADRFTDALTDDAKARELVRASMAHPSAAGAYVAQMVADIIDAAAEIDAIKEVERMEAGRAESEDDDLVERGTWHRQMAKLPELFRI